MRRFVQIDGVLTEVGADYAGEPRAAKDFYTGDKHYAGLRSPIDGADISTRSKHREYAKRNNLSTMDDYKNEWAHAAKARANIQAGTDPRRRVDVERALHHVMTRRR